MTVNSNTRKQHYKVFEGVSCDACLMKSLCTKASKRHIHQELREPLWEAMRERLSTMEGKKMYQKRMNTVEHAWGNIKFNNRVTMFHLRGLKKVNAEFQLLAVGHNIKKLSKKKAKS